MKRTKALTDWKGGKTKMGKIRIAHKLNKGIIVNRCQIVNISERLIIILCKNSSSETEKDHPRPVPRQVNKLKSKITETDFFSHTEYAIPWNQLRSMWILYFGIQDEFPEGVSLKEIRKAFRTCKRFETILEST